MENGALQPHSEQAESHIFNYLWYLDFLVGTYLNT